MQVQHLDFKQVTIYNCPALAPNNKSELKNEFSNQMTYNLNSTNFQKYNTSKVVESEIKIKKYFKILAPFKRMKDNIEGGTSSLSNRVAHRGGLGRVIKGNSIARLLSM